MQVVYHDVHVFVFQEVPHTMIKHTSLVRIKYWLLWDVDDKLISILAVLGHKMIPMDQSEVHYVNYSLGVIPESILISREITSFFECVTPALQWTRRYFPLQASLIFDSYFPLMNALHVNFLSRRHQFSLIKAFTAAARTLLTTHIMMNQLFQYCSWQDLFVLLLVLRFGRT